MFALSINKTKRSKSATGLLAVTVKSFLQETELSVVLDGFGVQESALTPSDVVLRILGQEAMFGLYSKSCYLPLELFDDDAFDER